MYAPVFVVVRGVLRKNPIFWRIPLPPTLHLKFWIVLARLRYVDNFTQPFRLATAQADSDLDQLGTTGSILTILEKSPN